jgi:hypothetical protein
MAPTLTVVWALLQSLLFAKLDEWARQRDIAKLKRTLESLKLLQHAKHGSDPSRIYLDERIDAVFRAIVDHQYSVIEGLMLPAEAQRAPKRARKAVPAHTNGTSTGVES